MGSNRGFTLIEVLVVVLILAVLAAVAVVVLGRYSDTGVDESRGAELQEIQTAVTAMLSDSLSGQLDSAQADIKDMDLVTTDNGTLLLSNYLLKLGGQNQIRSGCSYSFAIDGKVTQILPPE